MKNKMLAVMIIVALIFTALPFNAIEASAATSYTTKASVEKRIKTLNSEISKLNKTYKSQISKQKQQKKGTIGIYGDVVNYDPFIVCQYYSNTYYWINNPQKLNNTLLLASGYAKKTGKYKKWNGITCPVVKAVHVSNAANITKKKLNSKKTELKKLKKALKDTPEIEYKEQGTNEIFKGSSARLYAGLKSNTDTYNKLAWYSSDDSICTVTNGKVTGVSTGMCTITVKSSVSQKTDSFTISVVEPREKISLELDRFGEDRAEILVSDCLRVVLKYDDSKLLSRSYCNSAVWETSDPNVAYITNEFGSCRVNCRSAGTAEITCTFKDGMILRTVLNVKSTANDEDDEDNFE